MWHFKVHKNDDSAKDAMQLMALLGKPNSVDTFDSLMCKVENSVEEHLKAYVWMLPNAVGKPMELHFLSVERTKWFSKCKDYPHGHYCVASTNVQQMSIPAEYVLTFEPEDDSFMFTRRLAPFFGKGLSIEVFKEDSDKPFIIQEGTPADRS